MGNGTNMHASCSVYPRWNLFVEGGKSRGRGKQYVRRNAKGQIQESDDQGWPLSKDGKQTSKTRVKSGYGDRGDQKKEATKKAASKKGAAKKAVLKKGK